MGRKLDALLGRKFKTSKLIATVNLAVSRISVLKNRCQSRLTKARSDIIQLLQLNHHEQALNRVDQVIKEQNMLDVFVMIDGYCHLLSQMVNLIEQQKGCPDELKEAASSLLFAAPRCGEFPELLEIRTILTARFGKEFANGANELRSNCGVNMRMIRKMSSQQSDLETRMKVLQEIATENDIILQLDDVYPMIKEDQPQVEDDVSTHGGVGSTSNVLGDEFVQVLSFSESRKGKKKYRDVADAAQDAFESAAYAAAAARAAVELSKSSSFGSDNPDSPNSRPRKALDSKPDKSKLQMRYENSHESELNSKLEHEHKVAKVEYESESSRQQLEKTIVFHESENQHTGFSSPRNYGKGVDAEQIEIDSGNSETGFGEGGKMESGVQQLDFTRRPISVRNKRIYGR